jgi:hypothetical protein
MIANLKKHVQEQGYPTPKEEINYINAHNFHIYRDKLALEVPAEYGYGCTPPKSGNGVPAGTIRVEHKKVKNAVAFETYDAYGNLTHITMYGLGAQQASHTDTKVLFTGESAYIVAVGYDGTRKMIYGQAKEVKGLDAGVYYNISSKNEGTALSSGTTTQRELTGEITWNIKRAKANVNGAADQVWLWEAVDGGFHLKNLQTGLYFSCASGDNISDLKEADDASLLEAVCMDEEEGIYAFRLAGSNDYVTAASSEITGVKFGSATDESNLWKVQKVDNFKLSIPTAKLLAACYPFAMEIPEEVTAYVVTGAGKWTYDGTTYDYAYIEEVQGGVVPAYMPVIYAGAKDTYTTAVLPADNTPLVEDNLLHGTTIREYLPKGVFLGTVASTTVGGAIMTFKGSTSSSGVQVNKAYLLKNEVGDVLTVYLADKETVTSIDGIESDDDEVVLYDLDGVRVVNPEKNVIYVTSDGK